MPNRSRLCPSILALVLLASTASAAQTAPPLKPEPFPARIDLVGGEIFSIDNAHSYLGFSIEFLGLSRVRGGFGDYGATIVWDEDKPERSSVTLVIDPASIDTDNEFRDKDLKGPKFFEVEKYRSMMFQSTAIEAQGGDRYLVRGDLTIKGVTRPIAIPMVRTVRRAPDTAWGNIRIGMRGAVTIQRKEFGILGDDFWGDKTLAPDVEITIEILGSRPNYDRWSFQSKDKPSIGEEMLKTVEASGGKAAAARFRELRAQQPEAYNFNAGQLGIAINRLMQRRRLDDAWPLLEAGMEAYPEEPGFYARAGEAQAALGHRAESMRLYEKALSLNPQGTEATEMLRRLKAPPTRVKS